LRTYPEASGVGETAAGLIDLLGQTLAESIEADCTAVTLADEISTTALSSFRRIARLKRSN
jgi:hypothetical protein